jgi:hypothetical protein
VQAAVLDRTEPASVPLALPSDADVLYPDFPAIPDLGSAPSFPSSVPVDLSDPTVPTGTVAPASAPFVIDSLAKADWAVSRILEAEARITRRAALASELHTRIDTWFQKASAADNDSITFLSTLLRPYVESEIATQRRSRSLVLPSGVAQLRKLPDRLDIIDKDAALSYCETSHPEAVIVKKDLSRSALKTLIVSQGEAIPGCSFELGPDELYVKANA